MNKLLAALLLLLATTPASGEIYTWKDNRGTTHYTNSLYEIPERYRAKARIMNLGIDNKGGMPGAPAGTPSPVPSPIPASPNPAVLPVSPSPSPATALPSPPPASVLPSPPPTAVKQNVGTDRAASRAARRQRAAREEAE